ncbi:hypothetical protein PCASD_02005 [Puccinia coronata f. sp. avenae]|uniref:Uncharacterized protein n=1 Tax=Puccinia coronata f. sp. avenae TaxID=200324 RepID=A0A2N5VHH8_9BASI|nr:hypothetical protein PCASD_02005 [Puccinia coronata f. sp. avenae]
MEDLPGAIVAAGRLRRSSAAGGPSPSRTSTRKRGTRRSHPDTQTLKLPGQTGPNNNKTVGPPRFKDPRPNPTLRSPLRTAQGGPTPDQRHTSRINVVGGVDPLDESQDDDSKIDLSADMVIGSNPAMMVAGPVGVPNVVTMSWAGGSCSVLLDSGAVSANGAL